MPEPPLIRFFFFLSPHFIYFNARAVFVNVLIVIDLDDINRDLLGPVGRQISVVHGVQFRLFFLIH